MKKSHVLISSIKITFVIIFIAANYTLSIAQDPIPKWTKYKSEICKVKMTFLGNPVEEDPKVGETTTTYKTSSNANENVFFLGTTIHETPLERHYELAQIGLDSFVKTLNAELLSQEDYMYKKHKGIFGKIKLGETMIHYRTILIDQQQYQLVVIFSGEYDASLSEKFFKSFKVLK